MGMTILRRVPVWVWVVVALLMWGGWQRHLANASAAKFQRAAAEAAQQREAALQASITETERRLAAQQEVTRNAEQSKAKALASAAGAQSAVERMRRQLALLHSGASASNPASAGTGPTDRLANVLGLCVERYRGVAEAADRAVIAGRTCEAAYDSLTTPNDARQ